MRRRSRTTARTSVPAAAAALVCAALSGCSAGGSDASLGVASSPRVVGAGQNIPKGGGIYKVGRPYRVAGRWYHPRENPDYDRVGIASWYGTAFHGRRTSNGEIYDMYALTAGHPTLPMPSYAYVTNLDNGRTVLVRINDRGPYAKDRIVDLSYQAARTLGFHNRGLARVRVRYAGRAPLSGDDGAERRHLAAQSWYGGTAYAAAGGNTASISTASIGRASVAPDLTPAAPPAWSVLQYRRGTDSSSAAALGAPAATYLRVGPFATRSEAERLRRLLAGADTSAVEPAGSEAAPAYRLRLGPYDDAAAATAMARIAAAGFDPEAGSLSRAPSAGAH
jgi:rare lipoprotein A